MIQANEMRIGNKVHYQTAEGDILPNTIDWQDLKWLSEDGKSFNLCHSPIPLTEEWLVNLGFEIQNKKNNHYVINDPNGYADTHKISIFKTINEQWHIAFSDTLNGYKDYIPTTKIQYVHQLQNLYFDLTGEELTLKN